MHLRYQPAELQYRVRDLRQHSGLHGNVGRKIRRFLQQFMPGNTLEIELSGIVPQEMLRDAPLVYPNLYSAAAAFVANQISDPELASASIELLTLHPEDREEPSVLVLRVKMPGTGTEDLGLRELAEFIATVMTVVSRCHDFLERTRQKLPALEFFDTYPGSELQAIAVRVAIAARKTRGLPEGMTAESLPLSILFGIYAAYDMQALVDKTLGITTA